MTSMDCGEEDHRSPGKFQDFKDDDDDEMSFAPSLRCDMLERRNSFVSFPFPNVLELNLTFPSLLCCLFT